MTTNNHPAHDLLTSRRLHQMRDIFSKAAAQRDGGDIGYAMSDAVKLIDEVLAGRDAEPVGEFYEVSPGNWYQRSDGDKAPQWTQLYAVPQPAPVVPEDIPDSVYEILCQACGGKAWMYEEALWNACRAAMLQGGNAPVTPDGWIKCSDRMPERDVDVQVYCADKKEQMVAYMERNEPEGWFRFAYLPHGGGVYCKPTHWMPLPAAPQQEVNRG